MPNVSDSLPHLKCSPSHSVMADIGQTKTFLPYLLALDSAHLLYAYALSRTPAIESTHFSPSHRVLKDTCVGGNSSLLNLICPTSSYTRQYVPFYQVQRRAQTDTLLYHFFNMKCSMAGFSRPRTVTVRLTSCSYLYLCFCCRGSGDGERKTHQS